MLAGIAVAATVDGVCHRWLRAGKALGVKGGESGLPHRPLYLAPLIDCNVSVTVSSAAGSDRQQPPATGVIRASKRELQNLTFGTGSCGRQVSPQGGRVRLASASYERAVLASPVRSHLKESKPNVRSLPVREEPSPHRSPSDLGIQPMRRGCLSALDGNLRLV